MFLNLLLIIYSLLSFILVGFTMIRMGFFGTTDIVLKNIYFPGHSKPVSCCNIKVIKGLLYDVYCYRLVYDNIQLPNYKTSIKPFRLKNKSK